MPGRRGWGRRWKSQFRPQRISRFVEPCLLLLLHRGDSYGYDLLERLKEFGLAGHSVDSSVVYRCLREMEDRAFVTSNWDTEGAGPPRRVYELTSEGDQYLAWWVKGLRGTREVLGCFLQAYDDHMELENHCLEGRMVEVDYRSSS